MEPHRMLSGPEPPKIPIQIVAQIVAAAEHQQREDAREMRRLFAVVVVDDEQVNQPAHGAAHAQWAEDERPQDLVVKVAGAGHDEDADRQKNGLCNEGTEVEEEKGAKVDGAAFAGAGEVCLSGYDGLVSRAGAWSHCSALLWVLVSGRVWRVRWIEGVLPTEVTQVNSHEQDFIG